MGPFPSEITDERLAERAIRSELSAPLSDVVEEIVSASMAGPWPGGRHEAALRAACQELQQLFDQAAE